VELCHLEKLSQNYIIIILKLSYDRDNKNFSVYNTSHPLKPLQFVTKQCRTYRPQILLDVKLFDHKSHTTFKY
jgi:hypothetical protein